MSRNEADWKRILLICGLRPLDASTWAPVFAKDIQDGTFSKGDADIADWLPEILHESAMLTVLEENLNYTPAALLATFGQARITAAQAQQVGRVPGVHAADQEAIANIIYGGDWGRQHLGNTQPGDGWMYRGRSPIQITGRANYARIGDLMGQDLLGVPDLLAHPYYALQASIFWWEDRIPDSMLGETTSIRKRVNGGTLGLAEVQALTTTVRAALATN